ncbi:MAG: imidazole glycerol phosphate synthase subunit HisH [Anaerolinea sp.]|nr:imidazole glycerol phosphate synthase subunit HisH [Anaerolinea sp.]
MMADKSITVVDYGMGNIWSVLNALRYVGGEPEIGSNPDDVRLADCLVLPGVGSFRKAMVALRESGLDQAIQEAVKTRGCKILGICLGMQLMGSYGTEDGETPGLGLIPNQVDKFTAQEVGKNKVPHIGFNTVRFSEKDGLFCDLPDTADFYFVHSYRMLPDNLGGRTCSSFYGIEFLSGFEIDNICGTQFHPEKSQTNGLILLNNFLKICR